MTLFPLKVVTPDGLLYDDTAEELIVRTTTGDLGILAGHINCVAPLGMGLATVVKEGKRRYAGGMVSVVNGTVTLVPTTFEWSDTIDVERAAASEQRAKKVLGSRDASDAEVKLAEARLKRALVRKSAASYH